MMAKLNALVLTRFKT